MTMSITGLLSQKWTEWATGRKIGITIGVDPHQPDGARGGELWQVPIIEAEGTPNVQVSEYPMEYGKIYTDNMIRRPTPLIINAFVTNGYVSQLATSALLTLQDKLGQNWITNSVVDTISKIDMMLRGDVFCDITTSIRTYKNMKLIKAPTKEDINHSYDNLAVPLSFQEVLLFEPDIFTITKVQANGVVNGDPQKTKKAKQNVSKSQANDMQRYYINPANGDMCRGSGLNLK